MMPAMRRLVVAGTVLSGMYEYDATMAWVSLGTAQRLLRTGKAVTGVELALDEAAKAPGTARDLEKQIAPGLRARDWGELNKNLFAALKLEKAAMFVVLSLIVFVAAFNIASTLIMSVMQKRRDIAILKAMGATSASVRNIFMFTGAVIGAIGTLAGTGLGVLGCVLLKKYQFIHLDTDVFYLPSLPVLLSPLDVTVIALSAMAISVLATAYPAWRASRMDPVEVIRNG
jgi:lipoprotein-releasing system permease protein